MPVGFDPNQIPFATDHPPRVEQIHILYYSLLAGLDRTAQSLKFFVTHRAPPSSPRKDIKG